MSVQITEQDFYDMRQERDNARTMVIDADIRIDEQAATIARLTAAHAMQDESLVVLPRHMMNSIEEKLKAQAAEITELKGISANLAKHLEAINNICEREDVDYQAWKKIRAHCEAANVMEAV